ncbi:hypothetical protein ABKV19_017183 [Rosa sericea]
MASTTVASNAIVLEVLNQHNYKDWSSRVETYLLAKDLWDVVKQRPPASNGEDAHKAWRTKNARALHAIKITCGTEMFAFIRTISLAKKAWEVLEGKFKLRDTTENKDTGCTDLHTAAMKGKVHTVKELLSSMGKADLTKKDGKGRTALDGAIVASSTKVHWIQIARCMVIKNGEIVKISSLPGNYIPVVRACSRNKWEMARCLFSLTPLEALLSDNGRAGAQLINMCIWRPKGLDVAWNLLKEYPGLAMADNGQGQQPMLVLTGIRSAFLSGARLTLWQKLIYKSIHIQPIDFTLLERHVTVLESEDELPSPKKRSGADQGHQRNIFCSVMILFRRVIMGAFQLLGINHLYKMKSDHLRFDKFLSHMVEVIKDLDKFTLTELNVVRTSLFKAIEQGHVEFIVHMRKANPAVVDIFNDKKKSIFQHAIEYRQEKIYNLIYELDPEKRDDIMHNIAKFQTNMLHSAANLSPITHFNHIQGASLQMQRELQWFKEVESMLPSEIHEFVNTSNLTAHELFTKNHKKLKDEAEISMKAIATSCTTLGALIVTMMFAVAFTVPGGTNGNTGLPMFMHKKLFRIFILSDTISLISSATAVITFLGLLTSTYAENDFLWSLPTKMMIGLSTLFISIASMMITFSCALTIMFDGEAKMVITGILFASVPVLSFVIFLFPLLYEICISTYGPSIFHKKGGVKH